ncbi:glycosyltransferase family 2 protein [Aestuariivivens sediminicola]|uniref:glycosyltransferase family 2 protein n=1 Tax=Aestuariivivens sediminicola TaxID=2913560 RepID=UPI001F57BB53|nr:glycosyltransferase family 2 protein [Aestuariivivens sediminicola]
MILQDPLVSIIIPVFNRAQLVGKTIDSVLSQTYNNWECIVVDDGSIDDTIGVVRSFCERDKRISCYLRQRLPKGASTCRNIGLSKAEGQFVIFLDSDDYLMPGCLASRLHYFKDNMDCDFLVFPMGMKKGAHIEKVNIPISESHLIDFLSFNLGWQTMCPIWKTKFLKTIGGFKEGYPRLNDPELMIRALLEPFVSYQVSYDADYDAVYLPSKVKPLELRDKVYKSLLLFVPDVSRYLLQKGKRHYRKYLAHYLHLWFKSFYIPSQTSRLRQSFKLIALFNKHGAISSWQTVLLTINLLGYSFGNYIVQHFKVKLRDKAFYSL